MLNAENAQKPVRLIKRTEKYKGHVITVYEDHVDVGGHDTYWDYIHHNGAAAVLPVTDDGELLLVRQYRHAMGSELLEVPAGKLEPGEDHRFSALRELEEEVGVIPDHLEYLGGLFVSPGISTETIHLYLATGLKQGQCHPDEGEFLKIETMPFEQLLEQVLAGQVSDAKTAALVMRVQLQKEREHHE